MIDRKYLAGFFDAEGYVGLDKSNKYSWRLNVKISQNASALADELLFQIRETFGGFFTNTLTNSVNIHRSLNIYGDKAYVLLSVIKDYLVIKYDQVDLALKWADNDLEANLVSNRIKELKRTYITSSDVVTKRLSLNYIAGFFDGDGLVGVYSTGINGSAGLRANLTQNSTKDAWALFNRIVKNFGGALGLHTSRNGTTYIKFQIYNDNAYIFLASIQPYSRLKREQIRISLAWMEARETNAARFHLTDEEKQKNIIVISTLRELKKVV